MSRSFLSVLKKAKTTDLIEVKRRLKDVYTTIGFVVDFSDSLVLFHVLDTNMFQLNGYAAVREQDISHYRVLSKSEYWQCRAIKHFGLRPVRPDGILVASLPDLLKSVAKHYPLIVIHPERKKPDVCYIGPLISMTERTCTIEDLDCNAEWTGPRRIRLEDVTRVEFDGGYENALAATAPKRPKNLP
jgi:hypothetical protein